MSRVPPFALLAEFDGPDALLEAARKCREHGYSRLDTYTPFSVEGMFEAMGLRENTLLYIVLVVGILGGIGGYLVQFWLNAIDYPINVGGRPLNAWPAFFIGAFESMVLAASLAAVIGMLWLNGLPRLYHPVFNVERSRRITSDGFFLAIEASDPQFDSETISQLLRKLGAKAVLEVPE